MLKWLCFKVWIVHELDCIQNAEWRSHLAVAVVTAYVAVPCKVYWYLQCCNTDLTFTGYCKKLSVVLIYILHFTFQYPVFLLPPRMPLDLSLPHARAHAHTQTHKHIHTNTQRDTQTHTQRHTHKHTHTHTHTQAVRTHACTVSGYEFTCNLEAFLNIWKMSAYLLCSVHLCSKKKCKICNCISCLSNLLLGCAVAWAYYGTPTQNQDTWGTCTDTVHVTFTSMQ